MSQLRRSLALLLLIGTLVACAAAPEPAPSPAAPSASAAALASSAVVSPTTLGEAPDPFAQDPALGDASDPFAQDPALGDAPDPFAQEPALGDAPDPFAAPVTSAALATPAFDPDAVRTRLEPPGLEIHGRANGTLALTRERESVEVLEDDSFALSSVDLYVQYFPVHWFGVLAEGEFESDLEEEANGQVERELEAELELAILEFRPLRDERVRLRIGHFPVPFGLERRYYAPPRNELANRPAAFRRVYPGTYSDVGAYLWLTLPFGRFGSVFELEAGLTKGLDAPDRGEPDFWRKDENEVPQFAGRVALTLFDVDPRVDGAPQLPLPIRLTLGASLLAGQYDVEARRRIRFYGLDAEAILGGLRLRFEFVRSEIERQTPGIASREGLGLYALAAYHWRIERFLLEEVFVAFRYGRADPDDDVREDEDVERYHGGVGWIPYPGVLFKAGYELSHSRFETERTVYLELGYSF